MANPRNLIMHALWLVKPFGSNVVKTMLRLARECEDICVISDQLGSPTGSLMVADAILISRRSG